MLGAMQGRVLVVDDEPNIVFLVESALDLAGYETSRATTGREALDAVKEFRPDVIVLDVMLPDIDGFTVLRRLRERPSTVPVIFLTARTAVDDRVRGLTTGGDDYVVKPFAVRELVARVALSLRRSGREPAGTSVLRFADLEIDDDAHRVRRAGRALSLSPTEYRLLRLLTLNAGRVMSRAEIMDSVWDGDVAVSAAVLDTFISNLRRKVDEADPKLIHTVRSVGFCLRID
jgi:two-component system OmpR family response regulator